MNVAVHTEIIKNNQKSDIKLLQKYSNVSEKNFSNLDISNIDISESKLQDNDFSNSNLENNKMAHVDFQGSDLSYTESTNWPKDRLLFEDTMNTLANLSVMFKMGIV